MRTVALLVALLLPSLVLAQPARHLEVDASRGTVLPLGSTALADQAPAVLVNPAALSQLRSVELYYLHTRNEALGERANGLYVGDRFAGFLGLGAGVEWVRPQGEGALFPARRRTTWALSLGSERLSAGGSVGFFGGTGDLFLDRTHTFDLGVLSRPCRGFSAGLGVRNLNQPTDAAARADSPLRMLPRTWSAGVGLRPVGDRLTAGVEYDAQERAGLGNGRLSYLLEGELYRGLRLGAGFSHGVGAAPRAAAVQVSLAVDLQHLGMTYAYSGAGAGDAQVLQARASGTAWRSVTRPRGKMAVVDLARVLSGSDGTLALLGVRQADGFTRLTRLLSRAERDPALAGLVVKVEALPDMGLGQAEELRQALLAVRAAGKRVVAVFLTGGDSEYLVASAADQILLLPQSMLMVNGIAANVTFFGGAMEKLGVSWDVARVGAYKNAPDAFTRSDMSQEQRESMEAWLDVEFAHLVATLAEARGLDEPRIRAAMNEGLLTPRRAQELGLVDGILDPAGLEEWVRLNVDGARVSQGYAPFGPRRGEWGRRKRIVVIPVVGTIASGRSREDALGLAQVAGAETVVGALEAAAQDADVAAIVVRIDSGGGDALASDLMYRAVLAARKKKPVVATMGDVAASGGYYAAMGATEIWAAPTTLTGSIGIFFMKPAVGGLAEKLGVRTETIKRGELSNLLSGFDSWSEAEQIAAQKWVDAFYEDFVTEVASSRQLTREAVDQVARGRVWAGAAARDRGLVDHLGSFRDALQAARRLGEIPDGDDFEVEISGEPGGLFTNLGRLEAASGLSLRPPPGPAALLDPATRAALRGLGVAPSVLFEPGPKAMLPWGIHRR